MRKMMNKKTQQNNSKFRPQMFGDFLVGAISTTALFAVASPAIAGEVKFYCDDRVYGINVVGSEAFVEKNWVEVDLNNDGEWIRVSKDSKPIFAFNYKTGWRIVGAGPAEDAGCWIENVEFLDAVPLSATALLRRGYIELTKEERGLVQSVLASKQFYKSEIDGLWGAGTESAIVQYGESIHDDLFSEILKSPQSVNDFLFQIIDPSKLPFAQGDQSEQNTKTQPEEIVNSDADSSETLEEGENASLETITSDVKSLNFKDVCMQSVDEMANLISTIPFMDAGSVAQLWQSIGIPPGDMQGNTSTSNLLVLAEPADLTANADSACTKVANTYAENIGKQTRIKNSPDDFVHILYETSEEERSKIRAGWAFSIINFKEMDYSRITTNAVSFEAQVYPGSDDVIECGVRFHIMPSTAAPQEHLMSNAANLSLVEFVEWGISWFAVFSPETDKPIKWIAQQFPASSMDIIEGVALAANENFSAYDGGLNSDKFNTAIEGLPGGKFDVAEAGPRENNVIANSDPCQDALAIARESYARSAMP